MSESPTPEPEKATTESPAGFDMSVRGFKSIGDERTLHVRPLTLLAGANSSGKTSILQPFLLLKQTLDAPFETGPLLINGDNLKFSSAEQMFARSAGPDVQGTWAVSIGLAGVGTMTFAFQRIDRRPGVSLDYVAMNDVAIREGLSQEQLLALLGDPLDYLEDVAQAAVQIAQTQPRSGGWAETLTVLSSRYDDLHWVVAVDRFALMPRPDVQFGDRLAAVAPGPWSEASAVVKGTLRQAIHLPGLRGNPERSYPRVAIPVDSSEGRESFAGQFQRYMPHLLLEWDETDDQRLRRVEQGLAELGLTSTVAVRPIDDVTVEILVGRFQRRTVDEDVDLINIADVGLGVSQVLPVLVALEAAASGQVVILEQPELHLHPRAQRVLAGLLSDAAKRGVIVVAETHSHLLLREVQTLVARGKVDPGIVGLHWFNRDERTGMTNVSFGEMDEDGAFGDWPEDFDEVALRSDSDYLDAVSERRAQ